MTTDVDPIVLLLAAFGLLFLLLGLLAFFKPRYNLRWRQLIYKNLEGLNVKPNSSYNSWIRIGAIITFGTGIFFLIFAFKIDQAITYNKQSKLVMENLSFSFEEDKLSLKNNFDKKIEISLTGCNSDLGQEVTSENSELFFTSKLETFDIKENLEAGQSKSLQIVFKQFLESKGKKYAVSHTLENIACKSLTVRHPDFSYIYIQQPSYLQRNIEFPVKN